MPTSKNKLFISKKVSVEIPVRYLHARCNVRFWEDAEVDGVEDTEGKLIPCRKGDNWDVIIDLETGIIENWKKGIKAKVHYKVCDAGVYTLLNENREEVSEINGYVPRIMSPGDNGYGDYVIMEIDSDGKIKDWKVELAAFEGDNE